MAQHLTDCRILAELSSLLLLGTLPQSKMERRVIVGRKDVLGELRKSSASFIADRVT